LSPFAFESPLSFNEEVKRGPFLYNTKLDHCSLVCDYILSLAGLGFSPPFIVKQ